MNENLSFIKTFNYCDDKKLQKVKKNFSFIY